MFLDINNNMKNSQSNNSSQYKITATILVKTFGTLWVLGEESVDPPPLPNSVGCYTSNTFYISCTLYGPQLSLKGGGGKSC